MYCLVDVPGQVDHRAHIVVPGIDEGKDYQRGDRCLGQRQHDPRPDAVFAQSVQPRRLTQLRGNGAVELAHQEHAESGERLQHHHSPQGIVQAHGPHHDELGQHISLPWDSNRADIAQEQRVPPAEVQLRESIGREGGRQRLQNRHHDGDERRVFKIRQQWYLFPDQGVVLPVEFLRNPAHRESEHFPVQLQRGGDHPYERDKGEHSQGDQEYPDKYPQDPAQDRIVLADFAAVNCSFHRFSSFLSRSRISSRSRTG